MERKKPTGGPAPVGFFEEERAFWFHFGLSNSYARVYQAHNNLKSLPFNEFPGDALSAVSPNHAIITPPSAVTDVVIKPGLIYCCLPA
jgi:hypothetical protein